MNYYSTNKKDLKVDLREAVFKGLACDGGLYMPEQIPAVPPLFLSEINHHDLQDIAVFLSRLLFGEDIPEAEIAEIAADAVNFKTPLVNIKGPIHTLELFHGPTLAFKDVGARYMARMLGYFTRDYDREIHVLVATSGDTGSAVANGFLGVPGVKVHILYPAGLVSRIQEKQFTTLGENITAVEISGSFDDCQALVKQAFSDKELNQKLTLTSANSINVARLLPQAFYYFDAWRQMANHDNIVFCVPSGNFGNLTAGLIAERMGLPVSHFIAATNVNDIVPEYLKTGSFTPRPSVATVANAMDVGNPSNFARILDLFNHSHHDIAHSITGYSYTDKEIKQAISRVLNDTGYLLDPHGATGYMAAEAYLKDHPEANIVFLETAHPSKFTETVTEATGKEPVMPERLRKFEKLQKKSVPVSAKYQDFRDYLLGLL
ncbi:MAG TPA: threonine synthase [Bacteroidales bacterium]|nr:threonine synthase [Bacteroidales bacterium]